MENNLLKKDYPVTQSILPVPIKENPVPYTVSGTNANMKNYGIHKNYRNEYPTYCTTLPAPPRDQNNYNKYINKQRCAYLSPTPFDNDKCYFLEKNPTGPVGGKISGYFCGGSPNLNYTRGNEFDLDYPMDIKPVQDFNLAPQQPKKLQYYDMNLNRRNFENDYYLIESNSSYKSYPYNQSNTIIHRQGLN